MKKKNTRKKNENQSKFKTKERNRFPNPSKFCYIFVKKQEI